MAACFRIALFIFSINLIALGEGATVQERNEYKYIGQFTDSSGSKSEYFASQNAAGWKQARRDCKKILGDEAHLVDIETQEEFAVVLAIISGEGDTGSNYWTGGKWGSEKGVFEWGSGVEIGDWAQWNGGKPGAGSAVSKVMLGVIDEKGLFETRSETMSTRYVCEKEAKPCN